jgi:pyridoxamine 5'-phosphate oxidase
MELYEQPLLEADADPDPLRQFAAWFADAAGAGVRMPEACAIATATPDAVPSVRMVLMKSYDARGFVFFTNYESRKAPELDLNPRAAMMFYWDPLGRAVRIEGAVARTSAEESAAYVHSRPRASQLSAMASPQSQVISGRDALERHVAELAALYSGDADLPVLAGWGGYRLTPTSFEFWQNREDRLHDRLRYTPAPDGGWSLQRLAP